MPPTTIADVPTTLGPAHITAEHLSRVVARALGCSSVDLRSVQVDVVDYPIGSIATGALLRCRGTAADELGVVRDWSVFVKQLQSARVWPLLHVIPDHLRQRWIDEFPWRIEIEAQLSAPLARVLPAGMRKPELYELVEIDADHAALWLEDVDVTDEPWTIDRFARAARLLGTIAGRRPLGSDSALGDPVHASTPNASMQEYVSGRLLHGLLPLLSRDDCWSHPALVAELSVAGEASMRSGLLDAADRLDGWLALMETLPQTLVHGDASPQNLLVPRSDPETFVVIDWGFNSPHCVGFDVGQLLIGLVHPGLMPASDLAAVADAILPAYTDGLLSTGFEATPAQVRAGFVSSLLVRSLFSALPLEELGAPDSPGLRSRLRQRLGLTRYLLDLVPTLDRLPQTRPSTVSPESRKRA